MLVIVGRGNQRDAHIVAHLCTPKLKELRDFRFGDVQLLELFDGPGEDARFHKRTIVRQEMLLLASANEQ